MEIVKRNQLKNLLEKYVPSEMEDKSRKIRFLSFVKENERCFDRLFEIGHVTASAWLVNHDLSKALLTHHRKLNRWLQLGGHSEEGDVNILSSAIREAREESGLFSIEPIRRDIFDIDIHPIPASAKEPAHFHYDVRFLLRATDPEEKISPSVESHQLKWIEINTTEMFTEDFSVVRMFLKWKRFFFKE